MHKKGRVFKMVNLRYLVSILKSALSEGGNAIIRKTMFLNKADIRFLESNRCLVSIKQLSNFSNSALHLKDEETSQKYDVELDLSGLMILCN